MQYIGNYKNWITDEMVNFFSSERGMGRPAEGKKPSSTEEELEYQRAIDAGYSPDQIYFYMFDKTNTPFDIIPPFIDNNYHWWVTKMLPGNFMPMHMDPHTVLQDNSKRFWIPLQDFEPGHIFMYENQVITDYKKGDVWNYIDSTALHGAANIGFTPRIVLQISSYN
jgi:hypothetical protein